MVEQVSIGGQTITLIHYTYVHSGLGEDWRIACMPNMTEFHQTLYHPVYHRSNEVRAVTCPACKKEPVYKKAVEGLDIALRGPVRATS